MPFTKTSRPGAPPVCCGSRSTTISPAPVSARKISPFGATASHLGRSKFVAKIFTRNPGGTLGRNPAGGFVRSGPLPADLVANGGGSFGFCPCVTCASARQGRKKGKARTRQLRARTVVAFGKQDYRFALYPAAGARPIPNTAASPRRIGEPGSVAE